MIVFLLNFTKSLPLEGLEIQKIRNKNTKQDQFARLV